ncbi:MAG: phosphorylase family protein [Promethearchaeota archaeon]
MEKFFDHVKANLINSALKFMDIDEKLVRLYLNAPPKDVQDIVILPSVASSMKYLVSQLEHKKKSGYVYNGQLNGVNVSVIQTRMGTAQSSIIMECLKRTNCKVAIRTDFCGGLQKTSQGNFIKNDDDNIYNLREPDIKNINSLVLSDTNLHLGDTLIPTEVFVNDAVGINYIQRHPELSELLNKYSAINSGMMKTPQYLEYPSYNNLYYSVDVDKELFSIFYNTNRKDLESSSKNAQNGPKGAKLWSHQVMFLEDDPEINVWRLYGCSAVDMESSAIYLLGKLYNIKTISVLSISDFPDWAKMNMMKSNNYFPELEAGLKRAINLVISKLPEVKKLL